MERLELVFLVWNVAVVISISISSRNCSYKLACHRYNVDGSWSSYLAHVGPTLLILKPHCIGIGLDFSSFACLLLQAFVCMISQAVSHWVIRWRHWRWSKKKMGVHILKRYRGNRKNSVVTFLVEKQCCIMIMICNILVT